jgi:predicted Zn finger-like uncharacterized protein
MALATQCPHCHTTFRVASDQLKLRGGIVRCGTCQRIFDGNAHLIDLDALAAAKKASQAFESGADSGAEIASSASSASSAFSAFSAADASADLAAPAAAPATEGAPVLPATADVPPFAEAASASVSPAPESADVGAAPVYTLDFDHTFDPFGILPKAEPHFDGSPDEHDAAQDDAAELTAPEPQVEAEPAPDALPAPAPAYAYAPAGRIEPSFDLPVDEALVAQPLRGHEPDLEADVEPEREPEPQAQEAPPVDTVDEQAAALPDRPAAADIGAPVDAGNAPSAALPLRASADFGAPAATDGFHDAQAPKSARAKAVDARSRRSKLTPTRIEAPRLRVPASAESDEPEFVKRSRRQERSGKTVRILMALGAALLLLLLLAQLLLAWRSELALRYPAARPLLGSLCVVAGCRVGLPAKADNLVIDEGELAPIGTDTYSLNTTLRNQGSLVQAWPSIELELTDANNKPLLRRVFGPADYLPADAAGRAAANGFGAHSEQPVRLNFALAELKPSGYHTFVFYP